MAARALLSPSLTWCARALLVHDDAAQVRMPGFTLVGDNPVAGRAIVLHEGSTRVACGVIESTNGEAVVMDKYPGYAGSSTVDGMLIVRSIGSYGLSVEGTFAGLEPSGSGGWHGQCRTARVGSQLSAARSTRPRASCGLVPHALRRSPSLCVARAQSTRATRAMRRPRLPTR